VKNDVIVGFGSNINPLINIEKAIEKIKEQFFEIELSHLLETEPLGFKNQDNFFNGAIRFKTTLSADALKGWLFSVENDLGRVRTQNKNGPRPIDLDILVWNGEIVDRDVYTRDFLKTSIKELFPGLIEKKIKQSTQEPPGIGVNKPAD